MRRLRADAGQASGLGDCGDDRNGAIRTDGQHAVEAQSLRCAQNGIDVTEVDDPHKVGFREAGRIGVAVDGRDTKPAGLRLLDRPALMPAGTDEEDGSHARDATGVGSQPQTARRGSSA